MPVEFKDYYKTLGVERNASAEEIRKTFRALARKHHPDVATNKAAAEEKFKEINEAYEVLSDPEKRRKYDQLGAEWKQSGGFRPPPGWSQTRTHRTGQAGQGFEFHFGGTGFSDFFEQFFGGGRSSGFDPFGGGAGATRGSGDRGEWSEARKGQDLEYDILVTLTETFRGSVRSISLQRVDPRTGRTETQTFKVRIPPGVQEGQLIRVAGKGEIGLSGGPAGDLYLRVRFEKHPDFEVRGADLQYDLSVAPWEAVLGATVSLPTVEGKISVRIPPGAVSGQKLRIRGRGLPKRDGERGDLYAALTIQTPTQITAEEKRLWEQLAQTSNFNPRK